MTNQHPITPPPELIKQWVSAFYNTPIVPGEFSIDVATKAAQWGSDQELEACCEWLAYEGNGNEHLALHAARRPKPLSLKEQALHILDTHGNLTRAEADTIRRALEALPND